MNPLLNALNNQPNTGPPGTPSSLYEFALASVVFYVIIRYVPYGGWIAALLVFGIILSSPAMVQDFSSLLQFIQTGQVSGGTQNAQTS